MYELVWMGVIVVVVIGVFYMGGVILSEEEFEGGKISSFECGFNSVGLVHMSYSIHFFIMMLMFIFFDLEVVMFLSVVVSFGGSMLSYVVLLGFVVVGFYLEWWYGKLVWTV